jgi:hypothetical protein
MAANNRRRPGPDLRPVGLSSVRLALLATLALEYSAGMGANATDVIGGLTNRW